jgi:hypothetical protein
VHLDFKCLKLFIKSLVENRGKAPGWGEDGEGACDFSFSNISFIKYLL